MVMFSMMNYTNCKTIPAYSIRARVRSPIAKRKKKGEKNLSFMWLYEHGDSLQQRERQHSSNTHIRLSKHLKLERFINFSIKSELLEIYTNVPLCYKTAKKKKWKTQLCTNNFSIMSA